MELPIGIYIAAGFIAQLIDGALGMAYGVISTTFLLSLGFPPAVASASVHTAEVFSTLASGISHWWFGNVRFGVVKKLVIPGILGGILGAYVLTAVPGEVIKPFVSLYLIAMGAVIVFRAFRRPTEKEVGKGLIPLGAIGGFFDAIGGGGWGPIVTSTLIARGENPRFTIGSVNLTEFFVTVAESAAFFALIGISHWQAIVGLLVGGLIAAPLAAWTCKRLPPRLLMIAVGATIIALQIRTLYLALA